LKGSVDDFLRRDIIAYNVEEVDKVDVDATLRSHQCMGVYIIRPDAGGCYMATPAHISGVYTLAEADSR
jgi:hypothetical protein